jgi:hypothetical protein
LFRFGSVNPLGGKTTHWRAGCGKSARPVRREWGPTQSVLPTPILLQRNDVRDSSSSSAPRNDGQRAFFRCPANACVARPAGDGDLGRAHFAAHGVLIVSREVHHGMSEEIRKHGSPYAAITIFSDWLAPGLRARAEKRHEGPKNGKSILLSHCKKTTYLGTNRNEPKTRSHCFHVCC